MAHATIKHDYFYRGVAVALAEANRLHGEPAIVADVLRGFGIGIDQLAAAGVEEYDLAELREALAETGGD